MSNDNKHSPPVIWLEPYCSECYMNFYGQGGPSWCDDNVYETCGCGMKPTKYERVDE